MPGTFDWISNISTTSLCQAHPAGPDTTLVSSVRSEPNARTTHHDVHVLRIPLHAVNNGFTAVVPIGQEHLHGGRVDVLDNAQAPHVGLRRSGDAILEKRPARLGVRAGRNAVVNPGVLTVQHGIAEARPVLCD